jgi:hypothetical protein
MKTLSIVAITAFAFLALANFVSARDRQDHTFQVSSTTFKNNSLLPIIVIHNIVVKGSNVCSINGAPGRNESPELSWTRVPRGTAISS